MTLFIWLYLVVAFILGAITVNFVFKVDLNTLLERFRNRHYYRQQKRCPHAWPATDSQGNFGLQSWCESLDMFTVVCTVCGARMMKGAAQRDLEAKMEWLLETVGVEDEKEEDATP